MLRRISVLVPVLMLAVWAFTGPSAGACDINVRQAGFINSDSSPFLPRPYELWLVCTSSGPEEKAWMDRAEKLCDETHLGVNLIPRVLALETVEENRLIYLKKLGISAEGGPRNYLFWVGDGGDTLVSERPGRPDDATMVALFDTPKKRELKALLTDLGNYCVVLFVPGKDAKATAAARQAVEKAIGDLAQASPKRKVVLLVIDAGDVQEAPLLAELETGPELEQPFAGVVFGKGALLHNTKSGEEITAEWVRECVAYLEHNASDCGADPVFVREDSRELLMRWEPELTEKLWEALSQQIAQEQAALLWGDEFSPAEEETPSSQTAAVETAPVTQPAADRTARLLTLPALLAIAAGVLLVAVIAGWLVLSRRETV